MSFFYAEEWRGRLKVETMRVFPTFEELVGHCKQVEKDSYKEWAKGGNITTGFYRVYELSPDKKPKLLNKKVRKEVLGE